ncbi:S49 family peptidase [Photobacterium iliopiscarium]|uniref:S49 family peptidase n=1 Tax=Photobacterium iliopiscarium TaxID=56192 RepID=UPI001E51288D|nr:S49 family peptidase [Photobacterium iliopiscarium]MCD9489132.1 hypothetical protein [Photobacterium iliopiscarium]MCF2245806.1 hypothetical protein [Photobacterium iliopiscarium]
MSHSAFLFTNSILEKPQLITESDFNDVCNYLNNRNYSQQQQQSLEDIAASKTRKASDVGHGQMINANTYQIKIDGVTTYKTSQMQALCGSGMSYQALKQQADFVAKTPEIKNVVLSISSGGGEAMGCFVAAQYFKDTVKSANKNIITYIDEMACSAAYAWACISDEIIMNPEADCGSIGVVCRLIDQSKALDKAGIKPIYITSGADKVPFAEDGSFKQDFLDKRQESVDKTYAKFVEHVATMRGLDAKIIKDTQANVYDADEALKLGLVDKIMDVEQFNLYINDESEQQQVQHTTQQAALNVHTTNMKQNMLNALKNNRLL